jgi:hypothetical protein
MVRVIPYLVKKEDVYIIIESLSACFDFPNIILIFILSLFLIMLLVVLTGE